MRMRTYAAAPLAAVAIALGTPLAAYAAGAVTTPHSHGPTQTVRQHPAAPAQAACGTRTVEIGSQMTATLSSPRGGSRAVIKDVAGRTLGTLTRQHPSRNDNGVVVRLDNAASSRPGLRVWTGHKSGKLYRFPSRCTRVQTRLARSHRAHGHRSAGSALMAAAVGWVAWKSLSRREG